MPILAATILTNGQNIINDVPELEDVKIMQEILTNVGSKVSQEIPNQLKVEISHLKILQLFTMLAIVMREMV